MKRRIKRRLKRRVKRQLTIAAAVSILVIAMLCFESSLNKTTEAVQTIQNIGDSSRAESASSDQSSDISGSGDLTSCVSDDSAANQAIPLSVSQSLAAEVESICETYAVSGMSLAIFKGEDILYTQSYGYSDKANGIQANINTKYRIASISKAITGLMVMDLAEKGVIDINADISNYIGLQIRSPYYPDTPITTWNLLTHTSSITDSSSYFDEATDVTPFVTLKTIVDNGGFFTSAKPGSQFVYTNFGAGLLAGVIEGATGQRFYDYADQSLMKTMSIDAGYLRTKITDTDDLANIYSGKYMTANLKTWNRVESSFDHMPIGQMYLLAHGDLIISAVDLAKMAILLCGDGSYQGQQIVEKSAVEKMNTPQVKEGSGADFGLCISMTSTLVSGRTLHGHSGQAYGMVAGMYYDQTDDTGVVYITNGCSTEKNSTGNYAISYDILNLAYSTILA